MKVVIAGGASGYLGRHLVQAFAAHGHSVSALVRPTSSVTFADGIRLLRAEATRPETLAGLFNGGADMVISALGITRQADG